MFVSLLELCCTAEGNGQYIRHHVLATDEYMYIVYFPHCVYMCSVLDYEF